MSRWFRLYDDAINDPKILRLAECHRWQWLATLCIASKNDGVMPQLSDVALMLRMTPKKAAAALARLRAAGLLDETDKGLSPHNWEGRQYKSDHSTERVKRFRNSQRNVERSADDALAETAPESDTESEPESHATSFAGSFAEADASGADAPPDPSIAERDYFARGKALLGKNAGGQLAKLKASKGGNVALARAVIETASTKENPAEYVAGAIRTSLAAAASNPTSSKPLTEFQRKQAETNDVRANLRSLASSGDSSGAADRLLSGDPGERSESVRGGPGEDVRELPGGAGGGGG
jgi:Mn-dependent DtxR family transcriptional regulator